MSFLIDQSMVSEIQAAAHSYCLDGVAAFATSARRFEAHLWRSRRAPNLLSIGLEVTPGRAILTRRHFNFRTGLWVSRSTPATPLRLAIIREVLESALDAGVDSYVTACRRLLNANLRGWRKYADNRDWRLVLEAYDELRADERPESME